jgi:hypothetical protein
MEEQRLQVFGNEMLRRAAVTGGRKLRYEEISS